MNYIIGLLIFSCLSAITIYLAVTKKIKTKLTITLLSFTIASSFLAVNYDVMEYMKAGPFELRTAIAQIEDTKTTALTEIKSDVNSNKESIKLLTTTANNTLDKVATQTKTLSKLIETATALQTIIKKQKEDLTSLNTEAQKTKESIENLNRVIGRIALSLIRTTYFTVVTKNELGNSARLKKVREEIMKDINTILPMIIRDKQERSEWAKDLQSTLPPRK